MNVTYLIGNGFDVNLGLPTKYTDYYKEYLEEIKNIDVSDPKRSAIINFWKKLEGHEYDKWADFEMAVAQNMDGDEKSVKAVLSHFTVKFSDYLKRISQSYNCTDEVAEDFVDFIKNGYIHLQHKDKLLVQRYQIGMRQDFNISIVSLNYTDCIEKILNTYNTKHNSLMISQIKPSPNIVYSAIINKDVLHLHGTLETDNYVVIGIDSIQQFENDTLKSNISAEKYCVKRKVNESAGYIDREEKFNSLIGSSNIIYTYGVSFGKTDKSRWDKIRNWLCEDNKHILVVYKYKTHIADYISSYVPDMLDFIDEKKMEIMRDIGIDEKDFQKYLNQVFFIDSGDVLNCKFTTSELVKS